jgi:hypothetical protein
MNVIVNGVLHRAEEELVIVHLSEQDKLNISNMLWEADLYAAFPQGTERAHVQLELNRWKEKLGAH